MTKLLLVPLDDIVVFPNMNVTLTVDVGDEDRVLLVPKHEDEYASVGTVAEVTDRIRLPGGGRAVALNGLHRGVAGAAESDSQGRLFVEVEERPDDQSADGGMRELEREYRAVVEEILELRGDDGRIAAFVRSITEAGALADTSGYSPDLTFEQKVRLLETVDVRERLELALELQRERLALMQVRQRIQEDVESGVEKQQREYILRRQLDSIRKELGEDEASVVEEYRQKIAEAEMPESVLEQAERELSRLERMGDQTPEATVIRNYLDWLLAIPWGKRSEERLDPEYTREVLDTDHAGLDDVKDRIVEYIAVAKLRKERGVEVDRRAGVILTLIGPPGTGKTSIGESIARATGREFVRMSLGGIRDEAEIRGHRRTYIGALPGRLVRALRDAGTMNPVIMLDEVDKVGADWRGDPSSALLEVLDPAQNHSFRDHYLDVELDLSEVLFIATGNMAETIPGPLLDRMEVIRFDGYTTDEKVAIAKGYLWPRQRERNGLREDEVEITEDALELVVTEYTREAGVRQLERELGTLLRKIATQIASDTVEIPITVGSDEVRDALGRQKFFRETAERTAVPGVATGLAATATGGDVLFIEATSHRNGDKLVLTGQLGDVMKESAQIALSTVRALAGSARHRRGRIRRPRVPSPRPGGSDPEGRPERRNHHGDGVGVAAHPAAGEAHRRHDRRDHAPGPCPPDRRPEAEGARGARGRDHRRDHSRAQPRGPDRDPGEGAPGRDLPPRHVDRRGAVPRSRGEAGRVECGDVSRTSRFPPSSGAQRACSSAAMRSRSCTPPTRGARASTSFDRRSVRSRRERSPSACSSSSKPASSGERFATPALRGSSTC